MSLGIKATSVVKSAALSVGSMFAAGDSTDFDLVVEDVLAVASAGHSVIDYQRGDNFDGVFLAIRNVLTNRARPLTKLLKARRHVVAVSAVVPHMAPLHILSVVFGSSGKALVPLERG